MYWSDERPSTVAASSPFTNAVALLAAAEPKSKTPETSSLAGSPEGRTKVASSPGLRPNVSAKSLPTITSPAARDALPATSRPEMS